MKIRDSHATINGDKTEYEMPSGGLEIIASDGKTLFSINLNQDGSIRVDAGSYCRHNGAILEDRFRIAPVAANVVAIFKLENKK